MAVPDFLTPEEVDSLKSAIWREVANSDPSVHRGEFSTTSHVQSRDRYFLDSATKVHFFYESGSVDQDGFSSERQKRVHKVGHTLHWDGPEFKKVTFSQKMKDLGKSVGLRDPAVVQGMYIFKLPKVGSPGNDIIPNSFYSFYYSLNNGVF